MSDTKTGQYPAEMNRTGAFVRQASAFRDQVTADGSSAFPAEADRYHLYVSLACPWAHRTVIFRRLKGLEKFIGMSVVDPVRGDRGWAFRPGPGNDLDPVNGFRFLSEAYAATDQGFSGRVTVPVLWDRKSGRIVNNESADIIRMLNSAFAPLMGNSCDYYPAELRPAIDAINDTVYDQVNNGVYRAGFASTQAAYQEGYDILFQALDDLEARLASRRFLVGDTLTEADWRLFTTLVRFDPVYHGHFKCNRRRLVDYTHLWAYTRDLYQQPGVAGTVNMDHIKRHYYQTHETINPTGIVPAGPEIDFLEPHGREHLSNR
jgi:putative glutathione S-transferase